jgi:TP901 family phage tail tape measure protein
MADQQLTLGTLFTAKVESSFRNEMNKLRSSVTGLASDLGVLEKSGNKYSQTVETTNKRHKQSIGITNRYASAMATLGRSMKTVISYGGAAMAVRGITDAFTNGLSIIVEYDQGLKNLQAISGATNAQLELMGDKMEYVATVTKFSTTELAEGMVMLTQAGFSSGEAVASLDAVTTLATGTLSSMLATTDLMTTSVRAFGLQAVESGRLADIFANAVNKSKATIDKFRISFNYVASAASQANVSIEEVSAGMMNLYNNGMRASSVGTGLRQVLSRLVAPNRKLRDAFDKFGISLEQISPQTQGLEKALENLTPLLIDQTTGMVDMAKAYQLFGLRGAQAISILIKSVKSGDFEDALEKVYEVGTAAAMSAKQQEGLAVRFKQLKDRAGVLAIAIGERGLAGAIGGLIDLGRNLLTLLISFVTSDIGGTITSITVMTTAVLGLSAAISALSIVIVPIAKTIAGLIGPTGLFIAGIVALGTAFYRLATASERAAQETTKLMESQLASANALSIYGDNIKALGEKMHDSKRDMLAYRAAVKRLGNEYPELGKKLRELGDDYKAVHKLIEVASKEKADASAEAAVTNLKRFNKEYKELVSAAERNKKRLQKALAVARKRGDPSAGVYSKRLAKAWAESAGSVDKLVTSYENYVRARWKVQKAEKYSLDEAKRENIEKLRSLGISEEVIDQIAVKLIPTYDRMAKVIKRAAEARVKLNTAAKKTVKEADLKKDIKMTEDQIRLEEEAAKRKIEVSSLKIAEDKNYATARLKIEEDINAELSKKKDVLYENLIIKYQDLAGKEVAIYDNLVARKAIRAAEGATKIAELELKAARNAYKIKVKLDKQKAKDEEKAAKEKLKKYKITVDHLTRMELLASKEIYNAAVDSVKRKTQTTFGYEHQAIIDLARIKEEAAKRELNIRIDTFNSIKTAYGEDSKEYKKAEEEKEKATVKFEEMKRGARTAVEEVKNLRDVWIQINREAPAQIAGGIASGLIEFAKNAKTAEEAMVDFATSTLEWLARVIIQQQILNALQSIRWGGSASSPTADYETMTTSTRHTGGIVGDGTGPIRIVDPILFRNASKFHTGGIVGDEVPIIAKKKEGVFTEEQMKSLAPVEERGVPIVNIVNKTGIKIKRQQVNTKFDNNKNMILDVVLEAVDSDRKGFRKNLKGMINS